MDGGSASSPTCKSVMAAALHAGPSTMLVTSAPSMMAGGTGNLLLTAAEALLAEHRLIDKPPNGLGDLTAAVYLARILDGQPAVKALQSTTAAVYEILARTAKRGGDELQLETDAQSLSHPMAMVQLAPSPASGAGSPGLMPTNVGAASTAARPAGSPSRRAGREPEASFSHSSPRWSTRCRPTRRWPSTCRSACPISPLHGGRGPEALVRPHARRAAVERLFHPSRAARLRRMTRTSSTIERWYAAHREASASRARTSDPPRGVSIQAFGIFSKIRELDRLLIARPELR